MTQKKLLDPVALAKLSSLSLKARYVVEGYVSGLHQSPVRGFSQEFAQHREYVPGDDLRYIDWKILGRSDKYFVKQYKEETNLRTNIVLDASKSMSFGDDGGLTKLEYASILAASLAYLIVKQGDSAGVAVFDRELRDHLPPSSERGYLKTIINTLQDIVPGGESNFSTSLNRLGEMLHKKGMIIIISDLLGDPENVMNAIKYFRFKKNEVIVFHVLTRQELDLSSEGSIRYEDLETQEKLVTYPELIREDYKKLVGAFIETYKVGFRKCDIDYCLAMTDIKFDMLLGSYLNKRA